MSAAPSPSAGSGQPLRSALKTEDDIDRPSSTNGSLKVQIAEPESESQVEDEVQPMKQFPAGLGRRLSGRPLPSQLPNGSSRSSYSESSTPARLPEDHSHHVHHRRQYYSEKLLAQVGDWLEHERKKSHSRKRRTHRRKSKSPPQGGTPAAEGQDQEPGQGPPRARADSIDSQSSEVSFDRLQRILEDSMAHLGIHAVPHFPPKLSRPKLRKPNSRSMLSRTASSDTEYVDGDAIVPSCDAWLDNSKTMSYTGGASTDDLAAISDSKADKEREAWLIFKNEIIRIAHTLRLKGWRRVPLEAGDSISVERLSGALTNAVYVVNPPSELPDAAGKRPPPKLLLRVYGPQVEHLIDRDTELQVLGRLARKRIGPRLLGTFQNGRFEQFFNAITLTPSDIREPDMSKHIAKRMKELHLGIDLLPHERENGPGMWKAWDQWKDNAERVTTILDRQLEDGIDVDRTDSILHAWKANGYVTGAPWPQFREMVNKYRDHVTRYYKNVKAINKTLVFAHNDTQYGNILRLRPDDEKSPLLQPANKHKQLIVIDFEYAGPNVPGYEFANHFIEWTYNYHDPVVPFHCNEHRYPSVEEQRRFLKAYVDHQPKLPSHPSSTPRLLPADSSSRDSSAAATPPVGPTHPSTASNTIVDFMLDARVPPGGWNAIERAREEARDQRIQELLDEARLWRPASSVFWLTWGIVQAKAPGLDGDQNVSEEDIGPDEFDYLSYTQERAMLFWGDCIQMGLVTPEELPESTRQRLKIVDV